MKHIKFKSNYYRISAATLGLSMAAFATLFYASSSLGGSVSATDSATSTAVTLQPTLEIWTTNTSGTATSSVEINADPDEQVYTGTIRAHVSTNNLTGYTLTMNSNSNDAKMKHEDTSVTTTINPLSTSTTTTTSAWEADSTLNNRWGYSIGDSGNTNSTALYTGVVNSTSTPATIKTTSTADNDDTTDLTFGAKISLAQPYGTYRDTVVLTAVGNYVPDSRTLADITYMQDMNAEICNNTTMDWPVGSTSGTTYTLIDERDNNTYQVRKLADGNCWMVQNLRLDLEAGHTLTEADTDVTSDTRFTPENSTQKDSTAVSWGSSTPTEAEINQARSYHVGSGIDGDNQSDNSVFGNYYNWYAATAGTGTYSLDTTSDEAPASICPKGWELPNDGQGDKSWYDLLFTNYNLSDNDDDSNTKAQQIPLSLIYAGCYHNTQLRACYTQGTEGHYWASTAYDSLASGRLGMYATPTPRLRPQHTLHKTYGASIRCVAK